VKYLFPLAIALSVSACVPSIMQRDQIRLGMQGWMRGAAAEGQLGIEFHNVPDALERAAIVAAMDGHNYGPVVSLKAQMPQEKGARVVLYKDPQPKVFGDKLCQLSEKGFAPAGRQDTKITLSLCYNDLSYGYVSATSLENPLVRGTQAFDAFYRAAYRLLTDPTYERQEWGSSCRKPPC